MDISRITSNRRESAFNGQDEIDLFCFNLPPFSADCLPAFHIKEGMAKSLTFWHFKKIIVKDLYLPFSKDSRQFTIELKTQ